MTKDVKTVLISVADKRHSVELGRALAKGGARLISTGGTAARLAEAGLEVTAVATVTGFPEILSGRVKTLHPAIHGGLLARREDPAHLEELAAHGIDTIDAVVCNLYPFHRAAEDRELSLEEALELIDIGGLTMIRAGAKNYRHVLVVVDPDDYPALPELLEQAGPDHPARLGLAVKAFRHTAFYDAVIAQTLGERAGGLGPGFPAELTLPFRRVQQLRYGENPHQAGAFYVEPWPSPGTVASARQLQGKPLSFINLYDADRAWRLVQEFAEPACAAIKHGTPCGVAVREHLAGAYRAVHAADPVSIFGGVVAVNRTLDEETARAMAETLLHVVVAPEVTAAAQATLAERESLIILEAAGARPGRPLPRYELKRVEGGLLLQEPDVRAPDPAAWRVVTRREPGEEELAELVFAWRVMRHVISNAIVLTRDRATAGIGAGQVSRIGAAKIAIAAAQELERAAGSVLVSDAFFPFPDVVEAAAAAGVTAIAQPGGALRDEESVAAADRHGLSMVFTGVRHFRH